MTVSFLKQKGAILIMSLLIGSAITIVGVEVAMFVLSSIRQSRMIDHSTIAYYAAESGLESVMYQVRKEEKFTYEDLRKTSDTIDGASWSVLKYQEPDTIVGVFRDSILELQKATLATSDSIQMSLYKKNGDDYISVPDLKSLKVSWSSERCGAQRPSVEVTAVEFGTGGSINWNNDTHLKKDIQVAPIDDPVTPLDEATIKQVFFNFVDENDTRIDKPMIVRVKVFYCDLAGIKIGLYKGLDGANEQIAIPNYFTINPKGTYSGVTRDELKSTFAAQDAASSVFDFVLFSQEQVTK